MKYKFFSISILNPEPGEQALNKYLGDHAVISVEKQFVNLGQDAYWSFIVSTIDGNERSPSTNKNSKVDYKELLSPDDFTIYAQLRELRTTIAKEEAKPPYAHFY